MFDERAKERMAEGGRKGGQSKGMEKVPYPSEETSSRDEAGRAVGAGPSRVLDNFGEKPTMTRGGTVTTRA